MLDASDAPELVLEGSDATEYSISLARVEAALIRTTTRDMRIP
jgi:hypothetical protein